MSHRSIPCICGSQQVQVSDLYERGFPEVASCNCMLSIRQVWRHVQKCVVPRGERLCYVFVDSTGRCFYVGTTTNLYIRMNSHFKSGQLKPYRLYGDRQQNWDFYRSRGLTVKVIPAGNEAALVKAFRPTQNSLHGAVMDGPDPEMFGYRTWLREQALQQVMLDTSVEASRLATQVVKEAAPLLQVTQVAQARDLVVARIQQAELYLGLGGTDNNSRSQSSLRSIAKMLRYRSPFELLLNNPRTSLEVVPQIKHSSAAGLACWLDCWLNYRWGTCWVEDRRKRFLEEDKLLTGAWRDMDLDVGSKLRQLSSLELGIYGVKPSKQFRRFSIHPAYVNDPIFEYRPPSGWLAYNKKLNRLDRWACQFAYTSPLSFHRRFEVICVCPKRCRRGGATLDQTFFQDFWKSRVRWDLCRADAERILFDSQWMLQDILCSSSMPVNPNYWTQYMGTEILGDAGPLFVMKEAKRHWDPVCTPARVHDIEESDLCRKIVTETLSKRARIS